VCSAGGFIAACDLSPELSLTPRNRVQLHCSYWREIVDCLPTFEQVVENADGVE
jgi:hypothetical protein